ncbi:MAG: RNA 2'-phosphotransferase [Desulfobacterales bacterium]|nr:RNA 2'-phosphotransferase [Desulfobacterales bacterium]
MNKKSPEKLDSVLNYILGYNPYEFGLVPDKDGYVKIKDLLKAMSEDEELRYVRQFHIDEILLIVPKPSIEIKDNSIRSKKRDKLCLPSICDNNQNIPKVLYTAIRERSYSFVLENGVSPQGSEYIILASSDDVAEKIGKRKDSDPVILSINTKQSAEKGVSFLKAGDELFLSSFIPKGCFTGPSISEKIELTDKKTLKEKPKKKTKIDEKFMPGSFILNLDDQKLNKRDEKSSWKDNKKRLRREKKQLWPDDDF